MAHSSFCSSTKAPNLGRSSRSPWVSVAVRNSARPRFTAVAASYTTFGDTTHRRSEPTSTAFVESAINEIISTRMIKAQPMRWNRWTVQSFLNVRVALLDCTLERSFRQLDPNFRPANDPGLASAAA